MAAPLWLELLRPLVGVAATIAYGKSTTLLFRIVLLLDLAISAFLVVDLPWPFERLSGIKPSPVLSADDFRNVLPQ